jgi:ATP-dependent DNA helicase RecQ
LGSGGTKWKVVLKYFEEESAWEHCKHCDNCLEPLAQAPELAQPNRRINFPKEKEVKSPTQEELAIGVTVSVPKRGQGQVIGCTSRNCS